MAGSPNHGNTAALGFTVLNTNHVAVPDASGAFNWNPPQSVTMEAVIRTTTIGQAAVGSILAKQLAATPEWWWRINATGFQQFNVHDGSGARSVTGTRALNDGQWHHVALIKQLGLAWFMYAQENGDRLALNKQSQAGISGIGLTWVSGVLNMSNSTDNTNRYLLEQSSLYPFCNNISVWRCPGDRSISTHRGASYPRVRTLAMNCWLAEGRLSVSPGYRVFQKLGDLNQPGPSMTWVLMDEREDSIDDGYFAINMTGYPDQPRNITWANYPASYHGNSAGLTFADGHSEVRGWRNALTMPPLIAGQRLPLNVSSPNNEDLIWLQQRTSAKQ